MPDTYQTDTFAGYIASFSQDQGFLELLVGSKMGKWVKESRLEVTLVI